MTETTQLNVRVPLALKRKLKARAREEGSKLETLVESLLVRAYELPAEQEAGASDTRGPSKPPPAEPAPSPFTTKKAARADWDRQLKLLPPEMRDAWKEENPRP